MSSAIISAPRPASAAATSTGFKDWAVVCAALVQGRQSVILRKGGIAEGRDGFRFKHEDFFLFPTQFHQQMEKVRGDAVPGLALPPVPPAGTIEIRAFYRLEWAVWIDDWDTLARLEEFHIYRADVLRERFEYDEQRGIQCAFGRVYHLQPAWTFPDKPGYGGCRSWVQLLELPANVRLEPALTDEHHRATGKRLRAALGRFAAGLPTDLQS